ncbi:MAG: cation:proton antiporter [Ruegeria sp.]
MYIELAIFVLFAFSYSLSAQHIEKLPISGPIIFLVFGFVIGPFGLGLVNVATNTEVLRWLADLTLAIFLFVDAANTRPRVLDKTYKLPLRLLLIGLPCSIFLGFVAAHLFDAQLGLPEMALLGVMLAATDAALGKPVVSNPQLPERMRTALSVESGLNDGLCVPLLLFFIALSEAGNGGHAAETSALILMAHELGIGLAVGLVVSVAGSGLLKIAGDRGWISEPWVMVPTIMLALSCFSLAQELGGSGYIAAFVGGLAYRREVGGFRQQLLGQAEGVGEILSMATWVFVGVSVIGLTLPLIGWPVLLYAVLSLTVVRMVPVFLSLAGTGETLETKLFMGWFGPRGLASIVFSLIVLNSHVPNAEFIAMVVLATVFLSTVLHGITANPFTRLLAKHLNNTR